MYKSIHDLAAATILFFSLIENNPKIDFAESLSMFFMYNKM